MGISARLWLVPLVGAASWSAATEAGPARLAVVCGREASPLEQLAAEQLCLTLRQLFGAKVSPTARAPRHAEVLFLVGTPQGNPLAAQALESRPLPPLSDQAVVLRRLQLGSRPALLVSGGSPAATLWAAAALAEHWGVRHLLHGDVLPARTEFALPDLDLVEEPLLRTRQWRVINDFALGPESWGMADYRPVIDQLAKLRFNRLFFSIYPYQPFLDLEVRGIRRQQAHLWYDFHYPISADMVGRELYGRAAEFWNPDLPPAGNYGRFAAAGERLVHELMAYAHARGMQCAISATLTEFPPEFAPLLKDAQKTHQLGELGIVPGPQTDIDDPGLAELAGAVLRATVNTYPEADFVVLGMPEFRQWSGLYERAWQALDRKYGIGKVRELADVLATARQRQGYPGGAERAVQEVTGDLVALYFYDRLLTELKVLSGTRRPEMRFVFGSVAEELFPLLGRLLPAGAETLSVVDYTPSRVLQRRQVLAQVPSREVPCTLITTLHDDNVGVLPQLTTGSQAELMGELLHHGWAGFSTRYWLIGDHDPCVAYLAKAAWSREATPEAVYRDQLRAACGEARVEDMLTVFREVEAVTVGLEWHGLGLAFPVPGMLMKHWTPTPLPPELAQDREGYRRALAAAERAEARIAAGLPEPAYVHYWVGRLRFAIRYLDTVDTVRRAAMAEAAGRWRAALELTQLALASASDALSAYAAVARDQSDRGAVAVLNEYVRRPLQAKARELESKQPHIAAAAEPAALAAARQTARQRVRRLIYNDDGCGPLLQAGCSSAAEFQAGPNSRLRALPGTQIDSVFFCSGATHVLNHRSSVAESYAEVAERYAIAGEWAILRDNLRALEAAGTDALQLTIDVCRKHQLEVFYSHRINDIHNTFLEVERSTWFREHPEYWLGSPAQAAQAGGGDSPKHWWSALDFERPEVLDYLCRIDEDVCRRYDLDGIEIDYFRSPMFFRPNLEFQPATATQTCLLTDFQRRLREMTLAVGTARGRPLLLAVRVPATSAACRHVGIDIQGWLSEGLVDVLVLGGGYVPFTEPLGEMVQLGHRQRLPVYATISASGMRGRDQRYSSVEAWRGAAANAWQAGVDGVYLFNLFPTGPEPRFLELGSPATLRGLDKLFAVDNVRVLEGDLVQGIEQRQALPLPLPAGDGEQRIRVPLADDVSAAARDGTLQGVELRVQVTPPEACQAVLVGLNGEALAPTATDRVQGWLTFAPAPEAYRCGANEVSVRVTDRAALPKGGEITAVEVRVDYR